MLRQELFTEHFDCEACDGCFPYEDIGNPGHRTYVNEDGKRYCQECAEGILKHAKEVHEQRNRRVVPE